MAGGLLWTPASLSTLRRVTSSHQPNFVVTSTTSRVVETSIEDMGDGLRRAANELTQIEREYEGAVKVAVFWDPGFKVVFDTLNIGLLSCGVTSSLWPC
jgi:hypothetical protein